MKPAVTLKLNGKAFSLHRIPPTATKIMKYLDGCAADDIFTGEELARKASVGMTTLRSGYASVEELHPYTLKSGVIRYWGNPKAIQELKKQLEAGQ